MIPYLLVAKHQHRVRTVYAVGTGVATGLLGTTVPIIGASVGVILQLIEYTGAPIPRHRNIVDGIVDGSLAILAFQIAHR